MVIDRNRQQIFILYFMYCGCENNEVLTIRFSKIEIGQDKTK